MNEVKQFIDTYESVFGEAGVDRRKNINYIKDHYGIKVPSELWNEYKVQRGWYDVGAFKSAFYNADPEDPPRPTPAKASEPAEEFAYENAVQHSKGSLVPEKDPNFVKWGPFSQIKKILKSEIFLPTLVAGLNGNGKTESIIQACAEIKRDLVRANFTLETDEDDLIGGYRLQDGDTVWRDGPVIEAMKRGAVLLLDEIDRASHKVMALQSIMEGNGYYIKKTGEYVEPANGFTIIATANTKGKGSEDGRFAAANILDEALLDRFSLAIEQNYPSAANEAKILRKILESNLTKVGMEFKEEDEQFVSYISRWTDTIRSAFDDGGVDELVSTRRAVDIMKTYVVLKKSSSKTEKVRRDAIRLAVGRFDEDTQESFLSLYDKLDESEENSDSETETENDMTDDYTQF